MKNSKFVNKYRSRNYVVSNFGNYGGKNCIKSFLKKSFDMKRRKSYLEALGMKSF